MDDVLGKISTDVAGILDKALQGKEINVEEGTRLFSTQGRELMALLATADELRRAAVGETVTFIKNRNINFTNFCIGCCGFCAFRCKPGSAGGFSLSIKEILEKAFESANYGATEVCIQGGLNPDIEPDFYFKVCEAIKQHIPHLHIHAFSPMEVFFASSRAGCSPADFLKRLKSCGIGSMPGTAAEILYDPIRKVICPGKLNTEQWADIITTAHELGIPTTATIMYGHLEEPWHRAHHLHIIRQIQKKTGGFTEFVPLSFIHNNTDLYRKGMCGPGASGITDLKMHAISRIMLNGYIKNIQVSWLKLGKRMAQVCLSAGANDLGGTLIEEHISKSAGLASPSQASAQELIDIIRGCGRVPAIRSTTYDSIEVVA